MTKLQKLVLSLVAVAACAGAFGTYENYQQSGESNALLAENVEALSQKECPDWDWFSALRPAECTIRKKNLAGAFYYKGVFVPAGASYTVYGTRMECQFHLINRCDVTKQTSCRES